MAKKNHRPSKDREFGWSPICFATLRNDVEALRIGGDGFTVIGLDFSPTIREGVCQKYGVYPKDCNFERETRF